MSPGVDGLEAVGIGRDDVEFAAIGLEEHLRRIAGEFEIGEKSGEFEINNGETVLRATHDKGESAIGSDEDFVGLRNDGYGTEELESPCVVDGEGSGATIDYGDILAIGSEAGLDGFGISVGTAVDLAGGGVDGDELVRTGGSGVDAIAFGREIERERRSADGNAGDVIGGSVENEDVAAGGGDAPDFVALGVFAEIGNGRADGNLGDGLEFGEINDGERAVGGGDVGVHVEIGTEEGRAMFAEKDDDCGNEEDGQAEIEPEVFGVGHGMRKG